MNSHRRAAWTTSTRSTGIRRTIIGRGSRRRRVPAVLLGIALLGAEPGAHRLGELLQAARIGIDPARVEIELDLTPGVAVAGRLVADLDRDRDGQVSDAEGREFAVAVRPAIAPELDGRPIQTDVVGVDVAPADALLRGEGRLQLRLGAGLPALASGAHTLRYRDVYRSDIGVYLANALVPSSAAVAITGQRRDASQQELTIDFEIRTPTGRSTLLAALPLVGAGLSVLLRRTMRKPQAASRKP